MNRDTRQRRSQIDDDCRRRGANSRGDHAEGLLRRDVMAGNRQ